MFRLNLCRYGLLLIITLIPFMAGANPGVYHLRVDGIACPFCGYGIEKKLKSIRGVEEVKLNISEGVITVITSEGVELTENNMRQTVRDAGFTLAGFTKVEVEKAEKVQEEQQPQE